MKKLLLVILLLPLNALAGLQIKTCDLSYYKLSGEHIVTGRNGAVVNDFGTSFQIVFDENIITSPELENFKGDKVADGFIKSTRLNQYMVVTPKFKIDLTNCKKVKP